MAISQHIYYGGGKAFPVTEADRVVVRQNGKDVVVGFNHARAWTAALEAANDNR